MIKNNSKSFLYLVQGRASLAKKHLDLESHRADVLIYTFDEEIKGNQFLYKPNTIWAEGRNLLIKKAKKLTTKYDYYILLDDDIIFNSGSSKEFEEEVLRIKPDIAVPTYHYPGGPYAHSKRSPFKYSKISQPDCIFVCLSRELFYDTRLLPYHTSYLSLPAFGRNSIYYSYMFWINLCEYFQDRRIVNFNRINIFSAVSNDGKYRLVFKLLFTLFEFMSRKDPSFRIKIKRTMPLYYYHCATKHYSLNCRQFCNRVINKYDISLESYRIGGIKLPVSLHIRLLRHLIRSQFTLKQKNRERNHLILYFKRLLLIKRSRFIYRRMLFSFLHHLQDISLNIKIYRQQSK